ncbi:MAG: general secretion pathway protein GspK [Planctomycetaceae bacterium]|nr:general secretion pathway protein GspK [Planctomycetaceae bacterium]
MSTALAGGSSPRPGVALVVVLVVVALLSYAAYAYTEMMYAEQLAADAHGQALQARVVCDSAVEKLMLLLSLDSLSLRDRGGVYDNPAELQGIPVVDGAVAAERARFTVIAPLYEPDAPTALRYGLEDESAKLNLNALLSQHEDETEQRTRLMGVPGMSETTADSILDWLDEDAEPREFGAEADYYSGLAPAYAPKNGSFDTLEELLLVQGVTPQLLFGLDANRNGIVDGAEADALLPEGVDNADGSFDRGWLGYLTLYSGEANRSADGSPKININGDDLETLYSELQALAQPDLANFVVLYRQSGPYTGSGSALPASAASMDFTKEARYTFSTVLDLIGSKTSITLAGTTRSVNSPLANDAVQLGTTLPLAMDRLTTSADEVVRGRLNLNQAARQLLISIPGLTEEQVDQIIAMRYPEPSEEMPGSEYSTWIFTQGIVTLDEMKTIFPLVSAQGAVYRAQIVGYYEQSGPAARVEVVLDATGTTPRRLLWREISHLGRGFPTAVLGASGP